MTRAPSSVSCRVFPPIASGYWGGFSKCSVFMGAPGVGFGCFQRRLTVADPGYTC